MVFEQTEQLFAGWIFEEVLEMENCEDQGIFTSKEHIKYVMTHSFHPSM